MPLNKQTKNRTMSGITRRDFVNMTTGVPVMLAAGTYPGDESMELKSVPENDLPANCWKSFCLAVISTRSANRTLPARAIDNGVFLIFVNDCGLATSGFNRQATVLVYSPEGDIGPQSPL